MYIKINSIPNYEIDENANVRNIKRGTILSPYVGTDGYQHITLQENNRKYRKRVHRLMAEAFLNNCKYIDHIDGDRTNNKLSNLRAVTNSENIRYGCKDNPRPIRMEGKEFRSIREASRHFNIDRHKITLHLRGVKKLEMEIEYV